MKHRQKQAVSSTSLNSYTMSCGGTFCVSSTHSKQIRTQGKKSYHMPNICWRAEKCHWPSTGSRTSTALGHLTDRYCQGETPAASTLPAGSSAEQRWDVVSSPRREDTTRWCCRNSPTALIDYSSYSSILRSWVSTRALTPPVPSGTRIWYGRNLIGFQI